MSPRLYPKMQKGKAPNGRCFDCEKIMLSDRKRAGQRDSWCLGYTKNVVEVELMVERYCPRFEP
ncbi:hypothetical protein LCGC14_1515760 [marine sediment metagenome]|uniref:Uncharacterized protein n=1 Tax=marine sediment metagenome TaxID=412755 RepID=A0A0F9M177_9ZZZZ